MWTDSHAHLYELGDADYCRTCENALNAGVGTIIDTAVDLRSAEINSLRKPVSGICIFHSAGISPFDTAAVQTGWDAQLENFLRLPSYIAIGEIGLDTTNPAYPPMDIQLPVFMRQLELAEQLSLPVIVHSRGAEQRVLDMCSELSISRVLFHCFTGSTNVLQKIIEKNYYVSFSGLLTFKNSTVGELFRMTPSDKILLETDSPWLAPVPFRGKRNSPSLLPVTGNYAASIAGIDPEQLMTILDENFLRFFGKHPRQYAGQIPL